MSITKKEQRLRRSRQTRARIALQRVARLTVFRSNLHIYASIVSDDGTRVLASASTAEKEVREQLQGSGNRFIGCRSWENGDDGYDLYDTPVSGYILK